MLAVPVNSSKSNTTLVCRWRGRGQQPKLKRKRGSRRRRMAMDTIEARPPIVNPEHWDPKPDTLCRSSRGGNQGEEDIVARDAAEAKPWTLNH